MKFEFILLIYCGKNITELVYSINFKTITNVTGNIII